MATDRRSFLGRLAHFLALPIVAPLGVAIAQHQGAPAPLDELATAELYRPFGRVKGGDGYSLHIRAVTVDGKACDLSEVVESDDAAGWVMLAVDDPDRPGFSITRRLTGDVRYVWGEEARY